MLWRLQLSAAARLIADLEENLVCLKSLTNLLFAQNIPDLLFSYPVKEALKYFSGW